MAVIEIKDCLATVTTRERCTECQGSGKYVGLLKVERCGVCHGEGSIKTEYTTTVHRAVIQSAEDMAELLRKDIRRSIAGLNETHCGGKQKVFDEVADLFFNSKLGVPYEPQRS